MNKIITISREFGSGGKYIGERLAEELNLKLYDKEEYGKFDCCGQPVGDDGMYRNTACGYTIQEPKKGLLGSDPEWLVFIQFDENGIAYEMLLYKRK